MEFEDHLYATGTFLAGADEAGRGPLAGPVVAACAAPLLSGPDFKRKIKTLAQELRGLGIDDCKKLTGPQRRACLEKLGLPVDKLKVGEKISLMTPKKIPVIVALAEIQAPEIDRLNILRASLVAMAQAFTTLKLEGNGVLLIDGPKKVPLEESIVEQFALVKGDGRSALIGLASLAAKEYRDRIMHEWSRRYPQYGFDRHSGYPTQAHRQALREHGPCPIHRRTFGGVKELLEHA